jgi:hypothetical protein
MLCGLTVNRGPAKEPAISISATFSVTARSSSRCALYAFAALDALDARRDAKWGRLARRIAQAVWTMATYQIQHEQAEKPTSILDVTSCGWMP